MRKISVTKSSAVARRTSAPSRSANCRVVSIRLAAASESVTPGRVSDSTVQRALSPEASRLAVRTTLLGQFVRPDTDQESLASRPRAFDGTLAQEIDHLVIDPIGGAAQRQFAQRRQVRRLEEAIGGALGIGRQIDLALVETGDQFSRRQIDQQHLVGAS